MSITCEEHDFPIEGENPCDDCLDSGACSYSYCENCPGEYYNYKGVCARCLEKAFDWKDPKTLEGLPRNRPCPTCIELGEPNAINSEFRWNGKCYQCGSYVPVDLRWYYQTGNKKKQSEEDYLQSFEKSITGLLNG